MDQSHAIFVSCQNNEAYVMEEIESPLESHVRFPGEGSDMTRFGTALGGTSNNENKKNNTYTNQLKKYFNQLEKKIPAKGEVLLVGPGVLKNQFFKQVSENKNLSSVKIHMKDADKMTINQLCAMVREHYHSKK